MCVSMKILILIILIGLDSLTQAIPNQPQIDNVSLKNDAENAIEIQWSVLDGQNYNFTRYRIQYKDFGSEQYYEWPAQLTFSQHYINESFSSPYSILNSSANFECYVNCIHDPNCQLVIRVHKQNNNCLLYSNYLINSSSEVPNDREVMILTDISNPVYVSSIPTNHKYRFTIALFDSISKAWSDFSNQSNTVLDMTINLHLNVTQISYNSFRLTWNDIGPLSESKIARCRILESINGQNSISYGLYSTDTYAMKYRYYNSLTTDSTIINIETDPEKVCFQSICPKCPDCVFCALTVQYDAVSGLGQGKCILKKNLDIQKGIYGYESILASSFRVKQFYEIMFDRSVGNSYKYSINCNTEYGSMVTSNEIEYSITPFTPMNMAVTADAYNFQYVIDISLPESIDEDDSSYLIRITSDFKNFTDILQGTTNVDYAVHDYIVYSIDSLDVCYELCLFNKSCKAVRYTSNGLCYLISSTENTTICNDTCITKLKYSNKVHVPAGSSFNTQYCFVAYVFTPNKTYVYNQTDACGQLTFNISLSSSPTPDKFVEGQQAYFYCKFTNTSIANFLMWSIDHILIDDPSKYNAEFLDEGRTFHVKNLNHAILHGNLYCSVFNSEIMVSNNVTITIEYPITINVEPSVKAAEGANVTIPCYFDGYPKPTLNWTFLKDQTEIPGTYINNSYTIALTNISKAQNGTYMCFVSNDSSIFGLVDVIVNYKPSKPHITSFNQKQSKIQLNWNISDNGHSELKMLEIEISTNFSDTTKWDSLLRVPYHKITNNQYSLNLYLISDKLLRLTVYNELGSSEPSEPILLKYQTNSKPSKGVFFILFICCISAIIAGVIGYLVLVKYKKYSRRKRFRSNYTSIK